MSSPTKVVIFNPTSTLFDIVNGVDGVIVPSSGAASAGIPVVLNPNGVIDPSLTSSGVSALVNSFTGLSSGNLVTLYISGGVLVMQPATASPTGHGVNAPEPPNGWYSPALGFIDASYNYGVTGTVYFSGSFKYTDTIGEFTANSVGDVVWLADSGDGLHSPGSITLTTPASQSSPPYSPLRQSVGLVTNYAGGVVTVSFNPSFPNSGIGTVTSVGLAVPSWLTISSASNPIIYNGTFTIASATGLAANQVLATPASGTGILSPRLLVAKDIPGVSGVTVSSTPPTTNQILVATSGTTATWQTFSTGSGTVNSGTGGQLAFYSATGTTVSGNANVTASVGTLTLGVPGSVVGSLILGQSNAFTTTITGAATSNWTMTLPPTAGTAGQQLQTNGSGGTTWVTPSTSQNAQIGTSYLAANSDNGKYISFKNTSAVTVTIPQAGASSQFLSGWYCFMQNLGIGQVTVVPTTSTINTFPNIILGTFQSAMIVSDGTNYECVFTKISSTDYYNSISAYMQNDAGVTACQNQIVMQDFSTSGNPMKQKGLNIFLETNAAISSNYDGLQVNVGATIASNTSASAGHVEAAEFSIFASGSAVTLPQINGVKIRTNVQASTAVQNVVGLNFYLPEVFGTVTNYTGIYMDSPTGGGVIGTSIGVTAGLTLNNLSAVTNEIGLVAYGASTPSTHGYGILSTGKTAGIVANDQTAVGSFIGHGGTFSSYPVVLHDGWYGGTGSPEGSLTAAVGSMFSRQDSTIGDSFYVKTSGSGNTGWSPSSTVGPIKTVSSTYSVTNSDSTINCTGTFTVTLPITGIATGKKFRIKNIGAGTVTIFSTANIDFTTSISLTIQGQGIEVQWDGTQYWLY